MPTIGRRMSRLARRLRRTPFGALPWLGALFACGPTASQIAALPGPATIDTLSTGTGVKLYSPSGYLTGTILRVTSDTLIVKARDTVAISREAIDTLWLRRGNSSDAAIAGLAAGGIMAVTLAATDNRGGDDPGLQSGIGLIGGLGLALLGLVVASITPEWQLLFVGPGQ